MDVDEGGGGAKERVAKQVNGTLALLPLALEVTAIVGLLIACHPPPARGSDHPETMDVETVLAQLAATRDRTGTVGGEARLKYWMGGGKLSGVTVRLVAQRGVGFHLWTLDGVDPGDELICTRGELIGISRRGQCQVREVCDTETLSRILSLPIGPDGLFDLATGSPFAIEHNHALIDHAPDDDAARVITLSSHEREQRIVVINVGGRWRVRSSELLGREAGAKVAYNHYRPVKDLVDGEAWQLPFSALMVPAGGTPSVVVKWEELRVGFDIAPEMFATAGRAGLPACPGPSPRPVPVVSP